MQSEVGNAAATKKPPQASPGNLKNKMDRIKYMVISNWMENGFIEQLRGQIRCQIVKELKNPFKNTHHSSHLSIERKILNTIIIDYLKRYRYHYSLSVFKSEIGGQLIGSLSLDDTCQQLRVKEESSIHRDESILERLIHARTAKEDSADTEKRTPSNSIHPNQLEALRKEILCDVEQHTKTVPTSDLQENEWKDKYLNVYQQLLAALNRENELKCLLDENDIKLKSAKREIDYLERLVTAQNHEQKETEHHDDNNFKMKSIGDVYVDEMEQEEHEEEEDEEEQGDADREQEINDIGNTQMLDSNEHSHSVVTSHLDSVSRKYADLELDIKRRLQIQAMLETDSRRLSYRTKEFLNQLNQRKSETTQIIDKLQQSISATPERSRHMIENKENDDEDIEVTTQSKQSKRSYIQSNLEKLRQQRDGLQRQMRDKHVTAKPAAINEPVSNTQEESKDFDVNHVENPNVSSPKPEEQKQEDSIDQNVSNPNKTEVSNETNEISTEHTGTLQSIDEHEELEQLETSIQCTESAVIDREFDEAERERLERDQLEQDLLDDCTQSESFSGIDFLQNDFLEQYQKHIESMNQT